MVAKRNWRHTSYAMATWHLVFWRIAIRLLANKIYPVATRHSSFGETHLAFWRIAIRLLATDIWHFGERRIVFWRLKFILWRIAIRFLATDLVRAQNKRTDSGNFRRLLPVGTDFPLAFSRRRKSFPPAKMKSKIFVSTGKIFVSAGILSATQFLCVRPLFF